MSRQPTETATAQAAELAVTRQVPAEGTAERRRLTACLLDHLACLLAGRACPHVAASREVAASAGGTGAATAADGRRLPALLAAYVNGQTANGLDWDDTLLGHPGSAVISAALAAAESGGGTLADAARGVVAGYEIHWTLSTAAYPSASHSATVRGFTAWESVAAAAAAATARSAPVAVAGAAMRLAATHAPVPYLGKWYERPVPTVKNNLGWAAAIGVMSAELAEHGADGITGMLDGPRGFWRMAGSDRWEWTAPAGDPAAIGRLGFKSFPACWHIQEQLGTVSGLLARAGVRGDRTLTVTYGGPESLRRFMDWNPAGTADLAFSLPVLTALLVGGAELDGGTLYDTGLVEDAVRRAERGVRYVPGERGWVSVTDASGSRLRAGIEEGDYFNPAARGLDVAGVEAKYDRIVAPILGSGRAAELRTLVSGGWDTQPVSRLTGYFG
jgi:2-methylcitrate dehydratase PrpD